MSLHDLAVPPVHARFRRDVDMTAEKLALRATLTAAHLFGLAAGTFLRALRGARDPIAEAAAKVREAELKETLAWEAAEILGARLDKILDRHRPHYSPAQRFRILEIKNFLGWSADLAARLFRVCGNTVANWESCADPEANSVGSLVKPTPPVRRLADVVRATVQTMVRLGFGGEDMIAQVLARAGWTVSARSVRRIARERHRPAPTPPAPQIGKRTTPVVARFVHHVWMMDVTLIKTFLGGELHLAGVFDAFSRVPLALQVFARKPGAAATARLLKAAGMTFGHPRYLITDQGGEFRGRIFKKMAARLAIAHRFGTADNLFATARLERFWRSLKELTGLRRRHPLTMEDLERRLETALAHYLFFRPHQGLLSATPAEAFLGIETARQGASDPPRALTGQGPTEAPFVVAYLDEASGAFPFLKPAA